MKLNNDPLKREKKEKFCVVWHCLGYSEYGFLFTTKSVKVLGFVGRITLG